MELDLQLSFLFSFLVFLLCFGVLVFFIVFLFQVFHLLFMFVLIMTILLLLPLLLGILLDSFANKYMYNVKVSLATFATQYVCRVTLCTETSLYHRISSTK